MTTRVADLSVDELKMIIQETITRTLEELFRDPDHGLELLESFADELQNSLNATEAGGKTEATESVAARLGLSW